MKNYILMLLLMASATFWAQSPVIEMESHNGSTLPAGAYVKDANNRQLPYVGTWRYSQNGKELTIVLRRYTMAFLGRTYRDILAGEYKYVENGVTVINTLPNLDVDLPNKWSHNISGGYPISTFAYPLCPDCAPDEKRMSLGLFDPIRQVSGSLTLRLIDVRGTPALQMDLWGDGGILPEGDNRTEEDFDLHVRLTEAVLLKME